MNRAVDKTAMGAAVRPTGTLAVIVALIGVAFAQFNVQVPAELGMALAIVPAATLSYFAPRVAERYGIFYNHPAAWAGAGVTLIVFVAHQFFGREITGQDAMILIDGVIALVAVFTPIQDPGGAVPLVDNAGQDGEPQD